ncbi:disease resistance protein isoform X1 [Gossypium australe]|uniref:Disease resistance protein isoform X1 n=1 Tax=Gossypium australe TaxID=47621 RepID=A0A5B6U4M1_9ROSI|nr:disease resistance protein isoform X1 [Gossypium australe]
MGCEFCEAAASNSVGTLIVDCMVKSVGRQLVYFCRFHDNVEKLREKKRELADARDRLLHKIEDAKSQLLQIENDVQNLQSRADETLSDLGTLEEEIQLNKRCLNWCPNWSWRYQLSKKAMKKIQDISELLDKFGQLGPVGYPAPTALPTIDFLCSKEIVFSKSSETAFYQIIEALKDENINMTGLWGMGGVGKTTLAREVGSQGQKLNLFDKVVITVVSQKPNFERIQDQIAQYIGFDMKNEQGRRSEQELWLRLKNEPRILIILDDIWESINLKEKIGIPIGDDHKGCKVLLTTRRKRVCQIMECRPVVQLDCLDDDEAWTLFEKKAGLDDFSDDSIKTPAKKIVKKCGGLPIAIIPLASALKGKTNCYEWEAAYRRLEGRRLTEIEDVNKENAYVCLEASFDYLKNTETKTCFLLCSLFPEDDEIYVENLVGYAWGLELYKGMDSIKDVRSEVLASIEILKNSGLLLDCGERHVKMHDVVRQFALWIASSRKEISFGTVETLPMDESFKHYTAISFETDQTDELPKRVGFPYLKLLLLGSFMETSSEFFEGMKALQVCALKDQLISLAAFKFNMNLRTLYLIDCELSDISMLGKLKTLHILSLSRSDITKLPTEAGDLEKLRLLDLSYCHELRRITPNLIRRLSNLEELYLHGCSSLKWATEYSTKSERYSSLSELNLLPKLVVISLDISSEHLLDGFLFRRLRSFDVCIGIRRELRYGKRYLETCPISRSLRIYKSVDACKQLFEDVESLQLNGVEGHPNLIPSLDLGFSTLTSLDLRWCHSMQCLIDASKQQVPITKLCNLRKLSLSYMFDLEEMCNAPQPQGFLQKLEEVIVSNCDKMQVLFPIAESRSIEQGPSRHLSLQNLKIVETERCKNLKYIFPVANSLGQLHTLKIKSCSQLEDIIQDRQAAYKCLLQSLREVSLIDLPQLKGRDLNDIILTQSSLQKLEVHNCPQLAHFIILTTLKELVFGKMTNEQLSNLHSCKYVELEQDQTSSQHHPLPICFPNMTLIDILECGSLKSLFPIIVAQGSSKKLNVPNLQILKIKRCFRMEEIFQDSQVSTISFQCLREVQVIECNELKFLFPMCVANSLGKLQTLKIERCFGMEEIIQDLQVSSSISLQCLREVQVRECYKLKFLFPICVANSLGKLRTLKIERCFGMEEIIQHSQVSTISFQCLWEVQVTKCNNLKYLFPTCVAGSLGQLQILKIESCSQLQDIIQGPEMFISMAQGLARLNAVELINLPQLKGRDRNDIVLTSPSLRVLKVRDCPQLTPFIIPTNIQELEFSEMTEKKQISNVTVAEWRGGTSISNFEELFEYSGYNLSTLRVIGLYKLTELRVIWSGPIQVEHFQNLTQLVVHNYRRLRYIFSPVIARNLPQLWDLDISDCEELEQIIEKDQTPSQHHLQPICFPNLCWITIINCENLKCLFPITLANGGLPKLYRLVLRRLSKLEQVFDGDESNVSKDEEKVMHLPRLTYLQLDDLPNLVSFSPVGYHFVFQSLRCLKVKACPNVTTRFSVDSKQSAHAKAQASQSIDEIIVEESATAQETVWPIGSDIEWTK